MAAATTTTTARCRSCGQDVPVRPVADVQVSYKLARHDEPTQWGPLQCIDSGACLTRAQTGPLRVALAVA